MSTVTILIVSGGMGTTGTQLVRTALAQFPVNNTCVTVIPQVRTHEQLQAALAQAVTTGGIIVHTLVDERLRRTLIDLAKARGIVEIDLMSTLLTHLTARLGCQPAGQPGLYRKMREQDIRRIEAIEFAVAHDDGKRAHELDQAEIVLTGVSRVGKTPLSMYLSTLGWKVANVPLVKDIQPTNELFRIDHRRVIGLTIEPGQLVIYRQRRSHHLGLSARTAYTTPVELVDELEFARSIFRRGRFAVIDTTDKPIEECAEEIVARINASLSRSPE